MTLPFEQIERGSYQNDDSTSIMKQWQVDEEIQSIHQGGNG
jgi:hypothetical protein